MVARHGARTPFALPQEVKTGRYFEKWNHGCTQLTPQGERQHYLLGQKIRNKYMKELEFLGKTYDPRELTIISTNYNRTIMSMYSELSALYPPGSVRNLTDEQKEYAVPPFEVKNKEKILKELGNMPTKSGFQPVPIHVSTDVLHLLKGLDNPVCAINNEFKKKFKTTERHIELNDLFAPTLRKFEKYWGINHEIDFAVAKNYTDYVYASHMNSKHDHALDVDMLEIDKLMMHSFNDYKMHYDESVRLASTKFYRYIQSTIRSKIHSLTSETENLKGIKNRKMIFLSAHDSTLSIFLAGVEQKQPVQCPFASHLFIELWQKAGTAGDTHDHFYVKWIYNDTPLNINKQCHNGQN